MGQTVYKSDVGYRSILLYLFQLNYNYKSAFVMPNTFQRTLQHLVDANTVLQSGTPPLPPQPTWLQVVRAPMRGRHRHD